MLKHATQQFENEPYRPYIDQMPGTGDPVGLCLALLAMMGMAFAPRSACRVGGFVGAELGGWERKPGEDRTAEKPESLMVKASSDGEVGGNSKGATELRWEGRT